MTYLDRIRALLKQCYHDGKPDALHNALGQSVYVSPEHVAAAAGVTMHQAAVAIDDSRGRGSHFKPSWPTQAGYRWAGMLADRYPAPFVVRMYWELGREPDTGGLHYWMGQCREKPQAIVRRDFFAAAKANGEI